MFNFSQLLYRSSNLQIIKIRSRIQILSSSLATNSNYNHEQKTPSLSRPMPLRPLKSKSNNFKTFEFIDHRHVTVKGGKGGDGMICFLSLWCNPQAGPSGGDGGNGGHVIFEACTNVKSLNLVRSKYSADSGQNGMSNDMSGKNAQHLYVKVPVGTYVKNAKSGEIIADLYSDGMKFLAAKGGAGGKGNHYFLSNQNRHPRVAELGANGEENCWILEMKMIAHAGLVGFPNAGKSTLLSALSRAKPKIASYPFTTLKPSIGIIHYDDGKQLAIADLPGIIQDAHKNRGLGIEFLRHIHRCVCIFYVVDLSDDSPFHQLSILRKELSSYDKELLTRPSVIIANKIDTERSEDKLLSLQKELEKNNLSNLKVIPSSAKYGKNLTKILVHLRELYDHQLNKDDQDSDN